MLASEANVIKISNMGDRLLSEKIRHPYADFAGTGKNSATAEPPPEKRRRARIA